MQYTSSSDAGQALFETCTPLVFSVLSIVTGITFNRACNPSKLRVAECDPPVQTDLLLQAPKALDIVKKYCDNVCSNLHIYLYLTLFINNPNPLLGTTQRFILKDSHTPTSDTATSETPTLKITRYKRLLEFVIYGTQIIHHSRMVLHIGCHYLPNTNFLSYI